MNSELTIKMRYLGLCLAMTGCVPIQSTVLPVNIEGKTFRVELPASSNDDSGEAGAGSLNSVVGRICPQGFKTIDSDSSWNPLNGRVYRFTVQCDHAS
ncbi:MAG: hypothetical protein LUO80_13150 [Methylococcaceae bacterium]|nr:hypothetical protein [Methylococcaceae bacterium]